MKILFMGTDSFAVPSLEALAKEHQILAVVTRPDKPKGRGKIVQPTAVKVTADNLGIPVLEPKSLKSETFRQQLASYDYDIVVLVAYGKLLPEEFIEKPSKGCICLHPSKLPEYRGCSPIESAILDGKDTTAISVFFMDKEFDTGDVIYQKDTEINPEDTGGTLRQRLSQEAPQIIIAALHDIESGCIRPVAQDVARACWAPKIEREDGLIDWNLSAEKINNKIRAYNPKPGAFTYFRNRILKINKARPVCWNGSADPSSIIDTIKNEGPLVACAEGALILLEVQPEGKNAMSGCAFASGYRPGINEKFGESPVNVPAK